MFARTPRIGDWIVCTTTIPVTMFDHLSSNSGITAGTRGVVLDTHPALFNSTATVRFEHTFGTAERRVPIDKIRITRRNGGIDSFETHTDWIRVVRISVIIVLIAPTILFVAGYWWTYRTFDGLPKAFVLGAIDNAVALVEYVFTDPVRAAVFIVSSYVVGRFAFR